MRHGKVMLAIVLVLAALGADATAQSGHVLRLSSPVSKDHAFGRGAEKFKQLVADATRGQVDVQVHHANALSGIRESLEMVRLGSLDFQVCDVAHVSRFVPEMNALIQTTPGTSRDRTGHDVAGPRESRNTAGPTSD